MAETRRPNPGSDAAVAAGCRCPVLDNARGRGIPQVAGPPLFWTSADCPLHARPATACSYTPTPEPRP